MGLGPGFLGCFGMYMCYHILHIVWKWLAGTRGGGGGGGGGE